RVAGVGWVAEHAQAQAIDAVLNAPDQLLERLLVASAGGVDEGCERVHLDGSLLRGRRRERANLRENGEEVDLRPELGDAAVLEPVDVNFGPGDRLSARGHAV